MKFFEYRTLFDRLRVPKTTIDEFEQVVKSMPEQTRNDHMSKACYLDELKWIRAKRPYYNVYPSIVPMLLKVDLDKVEHTHVKFPVDRLCIRFAEPVVLGPESLRCMIVSKVYLRKDPALAIWCDFGHEYIIWQVFPFRGNIGEQLKIANANYCDTSISEATLRSCVQIVVSLALVEEIVEAEILNDDKDSKLPLDLLIDRAHRRGKVGWSVGRGVEMCPHLRRPHLGLRWTGPGKTVPKIVPIKGCVVHREAVITVPTGVENDHN